MYCFDEIRNTDAELAELMSNEISRQDTSIELIASENFVSRSVMAAMGSPLTNKYAEGYPGRRYYGGCECVDTVENLARDRVKQLFSAEHANVQPHSGSQANTAVYFAMLKPGDLIMGMNLAHGGHLTHGSPVNISGSQYKIIPYGVDEKTGYIDYDELRKSAKENLPKLIIAGASAYPRTIDFKAFAEIAQECGAYLMVDMAHIAGLVATGEHPSPIPYADFVTSTTHKTLRGPRGGLILCKSKYAKIVDKAIFPGIQGGPLMHIIAAKAVCFSEALSESFGIYQAQTVKNAKALAASLMDKGFNLVSGGTDNHLMLVDLRNTGVTGKVLEKRLDEAGVTCNKNAIPFDPLSPNVTSGIRLGTPAVTTRGMKESDMEIVAEIIRIVVDNSTDAMEKAKEMSKQLISKYPLNY